MRIKKTTALALALLMLVLSSCEKTDNTQTNSQTGLLTGVFTGEVHPLPEDYMLSTNVTPFYDEETGAVTCAAAIHSVGDTGTSGVLMQEKHLLTFAEDGSIVDDTLPALAGEEMSYINYGVITDDMFLYLANTNDEETGVTTYNIIRYNRADGSFEKSESLEPLFTPLPGRSFYPSDIAVDSEGSICIAAGEEIVVLDENFIRQFSVFAQDTYNYLTPSSDGSVYTHTSMDGKVVVTPIDKEAKSFGTPIECSDLTHIRAMYFADENGEYDMYYTDENGLHGMRFSDGSHDMLMSLQNSALTDRTFGIMKVLDQNSFIGYERDPETYQYSVGVYKKAEDVDLTEAKVIEIAVTDNNDPDLAALVTSFNRKNPGFRMVVTDFSQYNTPEDPDAGMTKLTTDILNGLYKPAIVKGNQSDEVVRQILANDLFTDLYPFIDRDEAISRDDLFGAFTRTFSVGGKLWGICPSFDVMTLIAPQSIVGERGNWTFEDAIDIASSLPDGVDLLEGITQSVAPYALFGLSGYGAFIDEETNTAHFDSDAFIRYLKYIASLPAEIDYSALPDDYYSTRYIRRHNGQVALESAILQDPVDWLGLEAIFNTKEFSLIGYPTADENEIGTYIDTGSAYLMTSFCEYPEEAWELLREIALKEVKGVLYNRLFRCEGFPILKSAYDKIAEQFAAFEYIFSLDGKSITSVRYDPENPTAADTLDSPGIIVRFTEEEKSALRDYLDNRVGAPWMDMAEDEITAIVNEEITAFTSGMRTAEETAEMIQSRVSLWLAEHE